MVISTACELWEALSKEGRLAPTSHDKAFVESLCRQLGIAVQAGTGDVLTKQIAVHLETQKVELSPFLIIVLNALQPLGMMLSDIYDLFSSGGVTLSDEQLLIQFDFDQAHQLSFSANDFRQAQITLQQLKQSVPERKFPPFAILRIALLILKELADLHTPDSTNQRAINSRIIGEREGLGVLCEDMPQNASIQNWLNPPDGWPYVTRVPLPPRTPNDPLSDALAPYSNAIEQLCARMGNFPNRDELLSTIQRHRWDESHQPIAAWSDENIARIEQDKLLTISLKALWHCHELAPSTSLHRRTLAAKITKVINDHSTPGETSVPIQQLDDLLNLPIWRLRSQIYSVWLITLVKRELKAPQERFKLGGVEGSLVFGFRETHIADIEIGYQLFKLVAELKTNANGRALAGETREENIQPDYVLLDTSKANNSVYVLEAKQYRYANNANFNAALRDYAMVHSNAQVALANYGPIARNQIRHLEKLCTHCRDINVTERCQAFGHVTPLNSASMFDLQQHLRAAFKMHTWTVPRLLVDTSGSMRETLESSVTSLWPMLCQVIATSQMPVTLALSTPAHFEPGDQALAALTDLFDRQLGGTFNPRISTPSPLGETLLLTDASGFDESAHMHAEFAGVMVLQSDCTLAIHLNQPYEHSLRRALPHLIASAKTTVIYT